MTQAEEAFRNAAYKGDLATLTRLVEQGVDVNAADKLGWTALIKAAWKGKLDCLEHLVAKGANLNAQDYYKKTALHCATYKGHAPCVESLLKAGADASLKDKTTQSGKSALDYATGNGNTEVVKLLENALAIAAQAKQAAAEKAAAEKAAAEKAEATALGLLQPLEALSLDADTLRRATAAAVTYCDAQGATSFADLVEHELLDKLVASLALKPIPAKKLVNSFKAVAAEAVTAVAEEAEAVKASPPSVTSAPRTKDFDLFISHNTEDSSHTVFQAVNSFMSACDKVVFNPTTNLSHVEQINKEAMAGAVRRSKLVLAALSEGFFASKWCEAEIEAAREAGIKVIPCFSGDDYGAKQVDKWVQQYKSHANFKYIFRENGRDVLNKQNPESVKIVLSHLATLC